MVIVKTSLRSLFHISRFVAIAFAILLVAPSVARADNAVTFGIAGGQRSAYASIVVFDSIVEVDGQQFQIGTGTLVVDDSSGTNAGWHVTFGVQSSGAPESSAGTGRVTLLNLSQPLSLAGQPIDANAGPVTPVSTAIGDLGQPRTVFAARPGFGKGTYTLAFTVAQELSANAADRESTLSLAVTITPGA